MSVINRLNSNWFFKFSGKLLGGPKGNYIVDTTNFLLKKEGTTKAVGFFQKFLGLFPLKFQAFLGKGMKGISYFPGIKKVPGFIQIGLLFQVVTDGFGIIKDSVNSFREAEGGFISKVIGGVKGGVKSFIKSSGAFAATVGTSILLAGITGPVGIVIATVGSMIAGSVARKLLDRVLKTPSRKASQPDALNYESPYNHVSGAEIVNQINKSWENKDFNPYIKKTNPFLSGHNAIRL